MTGKEAIAMLKRMQEPEAWEPQINEAAFEALEMAIKELEGNGMAQERKYTFGNDGFSLENAYHDCKLVFDGITDDDSFQKADTGLILYYANEIIYALHEALKGKDANVPSRKGVFIPDITVEMFRNASYVRLKVESSSECPEWAKEKLEKKGADE